MESSKKPFISAIIPAAGQGRRMKNKINKQYLMLKGKAILSYTVDIFEKAELVDEVIVVVNPDEFELCRQQVIGKKQYAKVRMTAGGATRQESVFAGLKAADPSCEIAVIHDGARPLLSGDILNRCIEETIQYHATVAAVPAKNTIKVVSSDGIVDHTPNREQLYEVHTPQSFDYALIMKAHQRALDDGFTGTDDASLVEYIGEQVKIVRDHYHNIKITTPEDLLIAETIIGLLR